jgi:hypothetical protein
VWGFISNYLLLQVLHLPTTLLSLLRSLPSQASIVSACRHYHCGEKNVSQQYYIFLFHFASAMMKVSLTANVMATMMATAQAMIYHCLFYDSNKRIVVIIYFSVFSWWNLVREFVNNKRIRRRERRRLLLFLRMAMTMAMLAMTAMVMTTAMIGYCSLLESNRMIAAIIYFLFIFNENTRFNLLATKVMGGGRRKVGWFFVMSMVMVTAMATTTIAIIDWHLFYDSNGTVAAAKLPPLLLSTLWDRFDDEQELCKMTDFWLSQLFRLSVKFLLGGMLSILNALIYPSLNRIHL